MSVKDRIISEILRKEGGYVNDPMDSGGETNFGITLQVARWYGYTGSMKDMPVSVAYQIYSDRYWDSVRASDMPDAVAEEIVDTAVNMGVKRASEFLQRSLNALSSCQLEVDGLVGSKTIDALSGYLEKRDTETLLKALNCLQGAFYIELTERREKDKRFVYGWLKNRVKI